MAVPGIPTSFYVTQGNMQVYVQAALTPTATSYQIQRSVDGVTYTNLATTTLPSYFDTTVTVGTPYWYQMAGINGSGTGAFTTPQAIVPAADGELSLGELRALCQQRADLLNSNFVTTAEWNSYINQSMYELYDLLIDVYEDYFIAPYAQFSTNNTTGVYPLPNGVLSFINSDTQQSYVAPPLYKLIGVDMGLETSNNGWATVPKYTMGDRNKFFYPNTASTIYGVFNLQYRMLGNNIRFIPVPSSSQPIRLIYIPKLPVLLADTDITSTSISGWIEYVIVDAAIKAKQKQEDDCSILGAQKMMLKARIEQSAINRDAGAPDHIQDTQQNTEWSNGTGYGFGKAGWALAMLPAMSTHNIAHSTAVNAVHSPDLFISYAAATVMFAYLFNYVISKLSVRVPFSRTGDSSSPQINSAPFRNFISHIIKRRSEE